MDHELKIFRDMRFGPVLHAQSPVQVFEADLIDRQKGQPNVLQPALSVSQVPHASTLLDSFTAEEDGVTHKWRVATQDGGKKKVSLVESVSVTLNHFEVEGFSPLIVHGLGGVLREPQALIVEKFWNRLENDRGRHAGIGVIHTHQVSDSHVVSKHNVPCSSFTVRNFQKSFFKALSRRLGQIFGTKVQTQVSVQVGSLLKLSPAINGGSGDPTNLEVVIEEHSVEYFVNVFAAQSLEMASSNTRDTLEDLTQTNHLALGLHCRESVENVDGKK